MIFMFLLATFKLDFVDGCEIGTTVLCECVCVSVSVCVCSQGISVTTVQDLDNLKITKRLTG